MKLTLFVIVAMLVIMALLMGSPQAQPAHPFGVQRSGGFCVFWTRDGGIAVAPAMGASCE